MVDERLQVGPNRAELRRAHIEGLARRLGDLCRAHDRVHEVSDGKQLIAVVTLSEDVDAPAFADPVEEDLEDAQPLRSDERLGTNDRGLDSSNAAKALRVDLRLAVRAHAYERV